MTWHNTHKEFRKQINNILNLTCDLCGISYTTTFDLVSYCNNCIERLEIEMNDIDE
jgi:hypothetical protein